MYSDHYVIYLVAHGKSVKQAFKLIDEIDKESQRRIDERLKKSEEKEKKLYGANSRS